MWTNSSGGTRPRSGWCQRSSASNPIVRSSLEIDQRLVVQLELVALDRMAQVALDRHPLDEPVAQGDVERLETPASELLGAVHRGVGVAQQLLGCLVAVAR